MKPIKTYVRLSDNQIMIPRQIVEDENLDLKQKYLIEFKDNSIELLKTTKLSSWRFWRAGKNAGFKMVLKAEHIPDSLRSLFEKNSECLYEISDEKIVIHFK